MMRDVPDSEIRAAVIAAYDARHAAGAEHLIVREVGRGRAIYFRDYSFGTWLLGMGPSPSQGMNDEEWIFSPECYLEAWRAALRWDGDGEPKGWYRHPKTGRRRPGGDASREFIHW